jgi:hypothetical protein
MAERLEVAVGEEKAALLVDYFAGDRIAGIHLNAFTRQPFALVAASDSWSVTTSHEVLEMLADPFGSRLKAAAHPTRADQRVRYLLEVCDPCLSVYYAVNGISVSDFYTPRYFDPVRFSGTRYSFTGEIQYRVRSSRAATSPGLTPGTPVSTSCRAARTSPCC